MLAQLTTAFRRPVRLAGWLSTTTGATSRTPTPRHCQLATAPAESKAVNPEFRGCHPEAGTNPEGLQSRSRHISLPKGARSTVPRVTYVQACWKRAGELDIVSRAFWDPFVFIGSSSQRISSRVLCGPCGGSARGVLRAATPDQSALGSDAETAMDPALRCCGSPASGALPRLATALAHAATHRRKQAAIPASEREDATSRQVVPSN